MADELSNTLQSIKSTIGVENVVLVQRDGLPVASAGVWFSKDEVFALSSATCAIFAVARLVHGNFRYLLMESDTSKVFLASLPDNQDYFLTITTAPRVNLAALFVEMRDNLSRISSLLKEHMDGRRPPLRSYSPEETRQILNRFAVMDDVHTSYRVSRPIVYLDRAQAIALRSVLRQVYDSIPSIGSAFLALAGGVRVSLDNFTDDRLAAMSFALHDASERVVRTLRNSSLQTVLCETCRIRHFIYSVPSGVFSLWVDVDSQKLGMIRLLLKHYIDETKRLLAAATTAPPTMPDELKHLLLSDRIESSLLLARKKQ